MLHVDSREKASIRDLVKFTAGPTHVMLLECADFLLFDRDGHSLGIERKAVSDLLGSLGHKNSNGNVRLHDQLDRMKLTYSHVMLLVEGRLQFNVINKKIITGNRQSLWHLGSIMQILWRIQASGVTVLFTDDKHATADWLRVLHNKSEAGCVLPQSLRELEQEEAAA